MSNSKKIKSWSRDPIWRIPLETDPFSGSGNAKQRRKEKRRMGLRKGLEFDPHHNPGEFTILRSAFASYRYEVKVKEYCRYYAPGKCEPVSYKDLRRQIEVDKANAVLNPDLAEENFRYFETDPRLPPGSVKYASFARMARQNARQTVNTLTSMANKSPFYQHLMSSAAASMGIPSSFITAIAAKDIQRDEIVSLDSCKWSVKKPSQNIVNPGP